MEILYIVIISFVLSIFEELYEWLKEKRDEKRKEEQKSKKYKSPPPIDKHQELMNIISLMGENSGSVSINTLSSGTKAYKFEFGTNVSYTYESLYIFPKYGEMYGNVVIDYRNGSDRLYIDISSTTFEKILFMLETIHTLQGKTYKKSTPPPRKKSTNKARFTYDFDKRKIDKKYDRYITLKETYVLRLDAMNKIKKDKGSKSPDYEGSRNELNAVARRIKTMKEKYNYD